MAYVYNGRGECIGQIVREQDREVAYDSTGSQVGWSDVNGTYDYRGNRIGDSGLLARLLSQN